MPSDLALQADLAGGATRSQTLAAAPDRAIYRPYGALRFGLSLMVVFQHGEYLLPLSARPFFWTMGLGIIAVMLFFIISGFVIAEANATFYAGRPVAFIVNRALRLVPPYVAALALAAVVQGWLYQRGALHLWDGDLVGSPLQPRLLLAGVLDIVPFFKPSMVGAQDVHFIPFAWSLRLEFTFYLAVFATLVVMGYLPKAAARILGIAATLAAYALFALYLARGAKPPHLLDAIPFFLLGMAMFGLWRRWTLLGLIHTVVSLVCVVIAFCLWIQVDTPSVPLQLPVVAVLLVVLFGLTFKFVPSRRFKVVDKALGDLSYPLYINHFIVLLAMSNLTTQYGPLLYVSGVLACIALSAIMLRLVEVPMKGIRDRVRGVRIVA